MQKNFRKGNPLRQSQWRLINGYLNTILYIPNICSKTGPDASPNKLWLILIHSNTGWTYKIYQMPLCLRLRYTSVGIRWVWSVFYFFHLFFLWNIEDECSHLAISFVRIFENENLKTRNEHSLTRILVFAVSFCKKVKGKMAIYTYHHLWWYKI